MSLIQQVTPAILESQAVLPDRELNSLYRFIALCNGIESPSPAILGWHKYSDDSGWKFTYEDGSSLIPVQPSIRNAIIITQSCDFTVYRISSSSL